MRAGRSALSVLATARRAALLLFLLYPISACDNPNRPTWSQAGSGDTVFDMPKDVKRVTITGSFSGFTQNFIVWVGGELIVNELMGTAWNQPAFTGTYAVKAGQTEIKGSTGVAWTFTEQR